MELERPKNFKIGQIDIKLPIFFPSVSSIKTDFHPKEYIKLLSSITSLNQQFLISAFDLSRLSHDEQDSVQEFLGKALEGGAIILMDSGNYESFWKDAQNEWKQSNFHRVLQQSICPLVFGFDEQNPPSDIDKHLQILTQRWQQDQDIAQDKVIIPIIHGEYNSLPLLCQKLADLTSVSMLAVPERRLGAGILERASTVKAIRKSLNETGRYISLHLLGTGNPISIAIYAMSGADSFDGLEWCQTVVDRETALLFHTTHADFFREQTEWGNGELPFQLAMLAHNLDFYTEWLNQLRKALYTKNMETFCKINFPERIYKFYMDTPR